MNLWEIYILVQVQYVAVSPNWNGCQGIVSSRHDGSNIAIVEVLDDFLSHFFQFVLHHQEAKEMEVSLNLISLCGLNLDIGCVLHEFDA
jgi:hypothetical protein